MLNVERKAHNILITGEKTMRCRSCFWAVAGILLGCAAGQAQVPSSPGHFNGLNMSLGNLPRLSKAQSRSISAENFTGEKGKAAMASKGTGQGAARELGRGWKISPSVSIKAKSTFTVAEINGSGAIQQIWMTPAPLDKHPPAHSSLLLGRRDPNLRSRVPLGDFFACGWGKYCQINSLPVCVNPGSALQLLLEHALPQEGEDHRGEPGRQRYDALLSGQLHAHQGAGRRGLFPCPIPPREQARRQRACTRSWTACRAAGQYVGTYLAWEVHSPGWWGEGEIKFYLDGDKEFPTICGTGTEDYFCGSYDFENPETHRYQPFSTPYTGLAQVLPPEIDL